MMSERDRLELRRVVNLFFKVGVMDYEQQKIAFSGVMLLFERCGYYTNFN